MAPKTTKYLGIIWFIAIVATLLATGTVKLISSILLLSMSVIFAGFALYTHFKATHKHG